MDCVRGFPGKYDAGMGLSGLGRRRTDTAMRVLPTHCDSCARSALVPEANILDGSATCPECGGPTRTLPGEAYAPEDAALFEQLESALRDSGVGALDASHLAAQLDLRDRALPGSGLARLIAEHSSLALLEVVVPREPAALRKAEGMLAALLKAHASHRSRSGFVTAEETPKRSTTG